MPALPGGLSTGFLRACQRAPRYVLPFLAAIVPDAFTAALERAVDALPIDPNFVPEPERQAKLSALRDEILQWERVEEGLCEATSAVRGADASPEAVLGLRLVAPELAQKAT